MGAILYLQVQPAVENSLRFNLRAYNLKKILGEYAPGPLPPWPDHFKIASSNPDGHLCPTPYASLHPQPKLVSVHRWSVYHYADCAFASFIFSYSYQNAFIHNSRYY